jgi:glycerol-3-phosphate dehydrogenase (NAD(P)+)
MKTASVIGAGSWGTALSTVLAQRGIEVTLWCRTPEQAEQMAASRENERYLPGVALGELITPTSDLRIAAKSEVILCAVPSAAMAGIADALAKTQPQRNSILISCTKGLERKTGRRMTEILSASLPGNPIAVLSGPNHAEEVGQQLATAAVIGCTDKNIALLLQDIFTLPWFRTYTSDDVAGIELGGATKNIYAICAGISEGLGLGDNAKAALVTRGLAEMIRLGTHLGGSPETFQGLSGVGDLIVTCYSAHSRNNRVGKMLGEGKNIDQILDSIAMVAEGVPNTVSFYEAAQRAGINTPIIDQAYAVISGNKSPGIALSELLTRNPRPETDP